MRRVPQPPIGPEVALWARLVSVAVLLAAVLPAAACRRDDCVGGDDGRCLPPTACAALRTACAADEADTLRVARITDALAERSAGPKALAAAGDFVLENDRVRLVLDAPDHPQGLAPSGGSIIDFAPRDPAMSTSMSTSGDQVNGFYQGAGVLPRDAVHYETWQVIDQHLAASAADVLVAVVFRGHLEGDRRVTVVTRYELRPCEAGVRVRSDIFNGADDANTLYLTDGLFWGDDTLLPFIPVRGHGFKYPKLDLLHLDQAWREWPFVAARTQAAPDVSYAVVPCDRPRGAGFNDSTLSAVGVPLRPTLPGDGFSYERFIIAAPGMGLSPAVGEALRARTALHGDAPPVTVTGRVVSGGAPFDGRGGRAASLLFYEPAAGSDPDDEAGRTPWSEAVPGTDGSFQVTLPPGRAYRIQPYAFGRPAAPASAIAVGSSTTADVGDITLDRTARLRVTVNDSGGQRATFAELVLIPVENPAADGAAAPSLYGVFGGCTPMLGPPHGGSPACNRALTANGKLDLLVPPGHYFAYVTRGPFATIDRAEVTLASGDDQAITLSSRAIPDLLPAGVLSGDFHVHGGASYDTSIPDQDRVVSFLTAGVDVIIATDHDVVTTYQDTLHALGVEGSLIVLPGVEATPNILWFRVPGEAFPKTIGHFNFWPLVRDPLSPRNGAPWDELREPGALMDAMEPLFRSAGVRQLNHPWSDAKLGRDQGFLRMIQYDPRKPTVAGASFAADVLLRGTSPDGHRNLDWDVQEVMSSASRRDWLRNRTLWFSLLSQGLLRAGTANSDSHSLSLERVGYPRNLVFGENDVATFDEERFDDDVRRGHLVGTNGPVLDVTVDQAADGGSHRPGLTSFATGANATLNIRVAAAPWIPVQEVRVFVNGALARTVSLSAAFSGLDHFGVTPGRAQVALPLAPLVAGITGDAWLVVEAGMHQDTPPDNEDGVADGLPDLPDADIPGRPRDNDDPRFDLEAIAPAIWPNAFTNPFLLDLDGDDSWKAPGLP